MASPFFSIPLTFLDVTEILVWRMGWEDIDATSFWREAVRKGRALDRPSDLAVAFNAAR